MKNVSINPNAILYGLFIAEFSPMEDAMPDESAPVQITKVIGGDPRLEGVVDYFCDHRNPIKTFCFKYKGNINHSVL